MLQLSLTEEEESTLRDIGGEAYWIKEAKRRGHSGVQNALCSRPHFRCRCSDHIRLRFFHPGPVCGAHACHHSIDTFHRDVSLTTTTRFNGGDRQVLEWAVTRKSV